LGYIPTWPHNQDIHIAWLLIKLWYDLLLQRLQLRTSKVNKFCISRTRIFWLKLMTDSDSGGQIKLKYTLYMKFPRGFVCAKFLGKFFATICHVGAAARAQFSVSHVGHHPDRSRPNQIMPGWFPIWKSRCRPILFVQSKSRDGLL